jgi:hypothetical protein
MKDLHKTINKIEKKFQNISLNKDSLWGFQIRPNTKFKKGLDATQINELETQFGFEFPNKYKLMLAIINGLDKKQISINPENLSDIEFDDRFYQYPRDFNKCQLIINEIEKYIKHVQNALLIESFDINEIEGFIPIYAHRAIVVFKNKNICPVISIYGDDVIIYGKNLTEYLENEFLN